MLVARAAQSTPGNPAQPTSPAAATRAAAKPSLRAYRSRAARMKFRVRSKSWPRAQGIQGARKSRLASTSRVTSAASASSRTRSWSCSETGMRTALILAEPAKPAKTGGIHGSFDRRHRAGLRGRDHRGHHQLPRLDRPLVGRAVLAPTRLHAGLHDRARLHGE